MSTVYRNFDVLTFAGFVQDLEVSFGVSPDGLRHLWHVEPPKIDGGPDRHVHLSQGLHREQLHPGLHLQDMMARCLKEVDEMLVWGRILDIAATDKSQKVVSLYQWCAEVLCQATTRALLGDQIFEVEPKLLEYFHMYESESWKLTHKLPRIFAKRMYAGKDKTTEAYTRYFQLPLEERLDSCYYIRTVEAAARKMGVTDEDIAIHAQMFSWG